MRSVSLPQFEGPIDLLLSLVRQNQLDLSNLPMAEVTHQFLEYLAAAKKLDFDLDSEWFYTAALLIHLKSRRLLPPDLSSTDTQPDPQSELVRQLLDREQLVQAAEFLKEQWTALGGWPAPLPPATPLVNGEEFPDQRGSLTLLDILQLTQKAQASIAAAEELAIPAASVEIEDMMSLLHRHLAALPSTEQLDLTNLWKTLPTDQHRSALFLGLLEAIRGGQLDYKQDACFAPISIWRVGPAAIPL